MPVHDFEEVKNEDLGGGPTGVVEGWVRCEGGGPAGVVEGLEKRDFLRLGVLGDFVAPGKRSDIFGGGLAV